MLRARERRTASIEERYVPVAERSETCIPTNPPPRGKITTLGKAMKQPEAGTRLIKEIGFKCPKQMEYLIQNVKIEKDGRFN